MLTSKRRLPPFQTLAHHRQRRKEENPGGMVGGTHHEARPTASHRRGRSALEI
ncbi:uncharacterized protein CTRU02_212822 [Colletotrichum truncatum]|uniref:Uncharacterized protein n=1 Tax=Colletotrichum truncatum TaxID=5467 RepID=A0ACC3YIZ8_COLTU|nr:uncharacterized protein CTRU02_03143 [Colletotrichum truncatum]KAF6797112.1 hypothetical protein CTRU02_03143 [Colletotrichum truncatum]